MAQRGYTVTIQLSNSLFSLVDFLKAGYNTDPHDSYPFGLRNCDFSGVLQSEAEGNGSCLAPKSGCPDLAFHIKFSL